MRGRETEGEAGGSSCAIGVCRCTAKRKATQEQHGKGKGQVCPSSCEESAACRDAHGRPSAGHKGRHFRQWNNILQQQEAFLAVPVPLQNAEWNPSPDFLFLPMLSLLHPSGQETPPGTCLCWQDPQACSSCRNPGNCASAHFPSGTCLSLTLGRCCSVLSWHLGRRIGSSRLYPLRAAWHGTGHSPESRPSRLQNIALGESQAGLALQDSHCAHGKNGRERLWLHTMLCCPSIQRWRTGSTDWCLTQH